MVRIAEYADFLDRVAFDFLVALSDTEHTGSPDQSRIETAADDATADIYARLGPKYIVPVDPFPPVLVRICVTLAIKYLSMSSRGVGLDEEWQASLDRAEQMLTDIAAGVVSLGVDDPQGTGNQQGASYCAAERFFTRDKMRSF